MRPGMARNDQTNSQGRLRAANSWATTLLSFLPAKSQAIEGSNERRLAGLYDGG